MARTKSTARKYCWTIQRKAAWGGIAKWRSPGGTKQRCNRWDVVREDLLDRFEEVAPPEESTGSNQLLCREELSDDADTEEMASAEAMLSLAATPSRSTH